MYNNYPIEKVDDTVTAIVIALVVFMVAWTIAVYIMRSKTLFNIARRRGIRYYGMAWVPGLYVWTLGGIADKYDGDHGMERNWRWALLVLGLVGTAAYVMTFVFGIIATDRLEPYNPIIGDGPYIMKVLLPTYLLMFGCVLTIGAFSVCAVICQYKLFESCKPKSALLLLLLSMLVPFAAPFCLRSCLKWDGGVKCEDPSPEVTGEPMLDGGKGPDWKYDEYK